MATPESENEQLPSLALKSGLGHVPVVTCNASGLLPVRSLWIVFALWMVYKLHTPAPGQGDQQPVSIFEMQDFLRKIIILY